MQPLSFTRLQTEVTEPAAPPAVPAAMSESDRTELVVVSVKSDVEFACFQLLFFAYLELRSRNGNVTRARLYSFCVLVCVVSFLHTLYTCL